jgi:subtilisin family serine protease
MKLNPRNKTKGMLSSLRIAAACTLLAAGAGMALYAQSSDDSANNASVNSSAKKSSNGVYVVQMREAPAVAYKGGVAGYKATAPKAGQKIDPLNADVTRYVGYLKARHDATLSKVSKGAKLYSYAFTFNGFAAKMTAAEAAAMEKQDGVLSVEADEALKVDTSSTPQFLGLTDPNGLWNQLGGPTGGKNANGAGEGMVIGMIDTGIWPENPSFADRDANGKLVYQQIPGWHGKCESNGTTDGSWNANLCNEKVIAAQHFNAGWGGDAGVKAALPWEFLSPRDYTGHGSHTSSTAGGNNNVQPTGPAAGLGPISGMAPRARIAMYKVCWETLDPNAGGCFTSDSVAAIDQAVADGVDVINFSISGTLNNFLSAVEVAFFNAAGSGVFVAASAGNSGPTTSTVAHPSVWATTVAASNHDRNGAGSVTLGNNATYNGASFAAALGSTQIIDSVNAGLAGADPLKVELCFSAADNVIAGVPTAVLDPAKVAGKIVLCKRGTNALVNKSGAVSAAGGVGTVLYNDPLGSTTTNALVHAVPTVHILAADGLAVKSYIASQGAAATASIAQATILHNVPAPVTASFSSRGPSLAAGGDILKPDVIAPGVDILAAVAPPNNAGLDFTLYQGTSMSSPHVAGIAALLKQLHPTWSPMMIKSALMTTATDVLDGPNTNPTVIFRQGAGHIKPNNAADPGLVFNSGVNDWLALLCGNTTGVDAGTCAALAGAGYSFDASDMNTASIAIGDLGGVQTVKRTVTNVGNTAATYTSAVTGMTGITTVVTPSSLTLNPGQSATFTVGFTRTTATIGSYTGGQLTWTGAGHTVRIPMVVRPVALGAPVQVSGTGAPINYNVKFGFSGPFGATPRGMVPATTTPGSVATNASMSFPINIPAGTTYARFSLFDEPGVSNDLDLELYDSTNTLIATSGGPTAAEEINRINPAAGAYTVKVVGFATQNPVANFTLYNWLLGSTSAGNMAVAAPATATTGANGAITLTFSALNPATKYLGSVAYTGSAGLPNPTIVRVDTP